MHTIVVSDLHLADAEPPHPRNPLWKRFKRPAHFIDREFRRFLEYISDQVQEPIELVFNGDTFDFDSVMTLPDGNELRLSWLERKRGLNAEEPKSRFKIREIVKDHPILAEALRGFMHRGNSLVFVVGNHDVELHWPSVQEDLLGALGLTPEEQTRVRFCEWFYVSQGDTLIEHGNQYDAYCLCTNPINPLIRKRHRVYMRLPFGNLAGKFMLNGMGLMNPHADSSFIRGSTWEYALFYFRYVIRTQPLLLWTWFWGAMATLLYSIHEGLLPAMTDPLTLHDRVEGIAARANSNARAVWTLKELHAHPAILNPLKVLRELWLDRAILLGLILFGSFQFFTFLNVLVNVSLWAFVIPVALLLPGFIFYASSVQSEVDATQKIAYQMAPIAARIVGVRRVIQGHIHVEGHLGIEGVDYLNTGTWSPAYRDVECTRPYGRKCFAWIRPSEKSTERTAELFEWKEGAAAPLVRSST